MIDTDVLIDALRDQPQAEDFLEQAEGPLAVMVGLWLWQYRRHFPMLAQVLAPYAKAC